MSNSQENWISTDDRMPDDEELVVFLEPFGESIAGDLHLGFRLEGEWIAQESHAVLKGFISHWIEIPDTAALIDSIRNQTLLFTPMSNRTQHVTLQLLLTQSATRKIK